MATGYIKPAVLVVQEIRQASPPLLNPDQKACIVGPAYQIINDALVGDYVSGQALPIPALIPGAIIEPDTVTVVIKNAEQDKLTLPGISLNAGDTSYTDTTADFIAAGVKVGDIFVAGSFRTVIQAVTADTITFSDVVPSAIGPVDAVVREIVDYTVPSSEYTIDQTNNTITVSVTSAPITGGQIYMTYKAIRAYIANELLAFSTLDEVTAQLGDPVPENPLAYALAMALGNTTVSVYAMPVASNDYNGYSDAISALAAEDVYFIVPLTDDPAVFTALLGHIQSLAVPEVKKWRMGIVAPRVPTETVVASGTGDVTSGVLYDTNAQFLQDVGSGVDFSYYVRIAGTDYRVEAVLNNQQIKMKTPYPQDNTNVPYEVVLKVETKADRLKVIKANISGLVDRRMVAIYPDVVIDSDGNQVPSYFAAAAVAGLMSGLPAHKPATFMGISGFSRTPYTDGSYFTEDEMNEIAGAGYLILTQDSRSAPVYIRHQITTDSSSDYTREISATRTIDYLSVVFENAIKPFIGRFNLIDEVVQIIADTLKGTARTLMSLNTAFIGAPLLDFKLANIEKLSATSLEVQCEVQIPLPLNYITLRIIV